MDCDQVAPVFHPVDWLGFVENDNPCRRCPHPNDWGGCDSAYVWTISASETAAYGADATLPADGWLYLWLWDTPMDGATYAHLELTGDLVPLEFELIHEAAIYVPGSPDVLDFVLGGCPSSEILVGRIRVQVPSPVEARTWGRTKAGYRVRGAYR